MFDLAFTWKNSVNAVIDGVSMFIGQRALKSLNSSERIQLKTMVATFNVNPSITTISCYSLTNDSEETDLSPSITSYPPCITKHNVLIISGVMNAQIGKNINHKFSLHNSSNRNGEHLTDFMLENKLRCLNTKFQKRKGKLWIYSHANNTKTVIDYILINKKWNNSALNCEVYSSFKDVSSNHQIVTAKIWLSLWRHAAWTTTTIHYDWSLLNNRYIRDKYMLTLRNKFNALQEISETPTPNDKYENFVNFRVEKNLKMSTDKKKSYIIVVILVM